jgi:hypothetical protein
MKQPVWPEVASATEKVSVLSFDLVLIRQAYSIRRIYMALSRIIHEHHKCISLSPQLIPYRFAKVS